MHGISESMAGRAAILQLLPFSLAETEKVNLLHGGFPEVLARPKSSRGLVRAFISPPLPQSPLTRFCSWEVFCLPAIESNGSGTQSEQSRTRFDNVRIHKRSTSIVTGHYLAGMDIMSLRVWSWVMRSSILDKNFGVRPFTICRIPGLNSWKTLIPASPPIVEPKLLNVSEADRA